MIFGDDLKGLGANLMGRRGIAMAFVLLGTLGFPFKWAKQRGGLKVEWTAMQLGLSPKRACCMFNWARSVSLKGFITVKEMEQGLGRLGFSANALTWERPFLGPLYSWMAIRHKKGRLRIPVMLCTLRFFLRERFCGGSLFREIGQRLGSTRT